MCSGLIYYHKHRYYYLCPISSIIRTLTVGTGITPVQSPKGESRTITAGRELHPAPKK